MKLLWFLSGLFIMAWCLDGATFYMMVNEVGIQQELNPLVSWAYDVNYYLPALLKLASTMIVLTAIAGLVANDYRKTAIILLSFSIAAGTIGTGSNLTWT